MSLEDEDGDVPAAHFQQPPSYRRRRTSSIHLDMAETTLLSTTSGSWIAQESIHHSVDLNNEYYHKISEAPFRKRFADYSDLNNNGKMLPGTKYVNGFYSGQQTAYFMDGKINHSNVIDEYTRPSLYQLMKHYQKKQITVPRSAGKVGPILPPIRHTNLPADGKMRLNSRERRPRTQSGEPEYNEIVRRRNRTPDDGENTSTDETISKMTNVPIASSEPGLLVKSGDIPIQFGQKEHSTYEKRKLYGKNLEKKWFSEQIQKKHVPVSPRDGIGASPDLFYSPGITESEGESDVENLRNVLRTDRKLHPLEADSDMFSSTDVLMGEEGELEESTASEYEIIIKDNVLMEKKTKHKMRKKRQRKRDKYLQLVQDQKTANPDISHMTDTQLRAMRLNLAKRRVQPRLKGKRKFLQVANVIFVALQFAKILQHLRKTKRLKRRKFKKSKKIALKPGSDDMYDDFERKPTPFSLKQEFLKTIGDSLIRDVKKLNIKDDDENVCKTLEENMAILKPDTPIEQLLVKVSEDVQLNRLAHRRGSDSVLMRPKIFPIEIFETSKVRRGDMSKSVAMSKSSMNRSKSCDRNRKCTCARGRLKTNSRKKSVKCLVHGVNKESIVKEKTILFDREEVLRKRRPSLNMEEIKSGKAIDLHDLLAGIDIPAKDIKIQIALRKMRRRRMRQSVRPDNVVQRAVDRRPRFGFEEVIIPLNVLQKHVSQKTLHHERKEEKNQKEERSEHGVKTGQSFPYQKDDRYDYQAPGQSVPSYGVCDDTTSKYGYNATPITSYGERDYCSNKDSHTISVKPIMSYGGLSWDPVTAPSRPRYSDQEIAKEMERVSTLMLQLKDCRYIRWTPFHQAVIARMEMANYQSIC